MASDSRRHRPLRRLAAAALFAGLVSLVVGSCSSSPDAAQSQPVSASGSPTPDSSVSAPTQSPPPKVNVEVDWDSGSGSAANPAPDPSPTGWYEAAFGTSPTGQGKVIYLTFDDGPAAQTADVLKLLRANDARVTFFVLGQQAAANPGMVKRIHDEGHAIGNHSWDHTDLKTLTRAEIVSQLERTQRAAAPYIGACMRPPYGAVNSKVGTTSESLGLQPIMWTAQAWDWRPPPTSKIVADMKSGTTDGAVLLLHDGGGDRTNTVDALKELLPWWKRDGYRLAAIPTCA